MANSIFWDWDTPRPFNTNKNSVPLPTGGLVVGKQVSFTRICNLCKNDINYDKEDIYSIGYEPQIKERYAPGSTLISKVIFFHAQCFLQIAGEQIVNKLK